MEVSEIKLLLEFIFNFAFQGAIAIMMSLMFSPYSAFKTHVDFECSYCTVPWHSACRIAFSLYIEQQM